MNRKGIMLQKTTKEMWVTDKKWYKVTRGGITMIVTAADAQQAIVGFNALSKEFGKQTGIGDYEVSETSLEEWAIREAYARL